MNAQIYRKPSIIDTAVLRNHIHSSIINKLSGKNPETDVYLYTNNQQPYLKIMERDPNCWLNGVKNIGCLTSAQLDGNLPWSAKLGTLISPRHVYFSGHYGPCGFNMKYYSSGFYQCGSNPVEILFTNGSNQTISRKIIKGMLVGSSWQGPNTGAEGVGLLDEDVPPDLYPFARVLPPNFNTYFGLFNNNLSPPEVTNQYPPKYYPNDPPNWVYVVSSTWNQSNFSFPGTELYKAQTVALAKLISTNVLDVTDPLHEDSVFQGSDMGVWSYPYYRTLTPPATLTTIINDPLKDWFYPNGVKVGDSGRPIFLLINNELVLLGLWTTGGGGYLVSAQQYYRSINQVMQKLGGGYQLSPINLEYVYNKYKT